MGSIADNDFRTAIEIAETVILKANGGDLEIVIGVNEVRWTRCYLVSEGRMPNDKLLLGASVLTSVVKGLLKAVQTNDGNTVEPTVEMNGITVKSATHLEETHHSLYYGDEGKTRVLFWECDKQAPVVLVGVIRLSPEHRAQWVETLTAILESC